MDLLLLFFSESFVLNWHKAYNNFNSTFCTTYDTVFPMNKMKIKTKNLKSPWITKRMKKSSTKKQLLYSKFFKKTNEKTKKTISGLQNAFCIY